MSGLFSELGLEVQEHLAAAAGGITVLNRDVIEAEVVNTITETTVYSYSVAGNTLGTTGVLRLTVLADHLNNSGGAVVTTIRAKFGGTTVGGNGPSLATGASRRPLKMIVEIVAANATNAQRASVHIMWGDASGIAGEIGGMGGDSITGHSSLALDSTVAQTLSITVEHASAAATISTIARTAILESL